MDLSKSRKSKNVDDIRKQKPKVRTGFNVFGESPEALVKKGNKVSVDGYVTGKTQESKRKVKPMKGSPELGPKVGLDKMDKVANEMQAGPLVPEGYKQMKPTQITGAVYPEEYKPKK